MVLNCAIYVRQSADVQEGIDRQIERCTSLATMRGWTVTTTYRDNDVSASTKRGDGTAWARLIADITAGRVNIVISVDMDRLLRSMRDLVTLTELGASVVTVDGQIDLSSADGKFRAQMLAAVAEFEVRRKAERMIRANEKRAKKGIPVTGRRPFGFERDKMTPRESEAAELRSIYLRVIAGESIYSICRDLNRRGVLTATGKTWGTAQLKRVLKRPSVAGIMSRHGEEMPVSKITPLVPREDWDLVQAILNGRSETSGPKVERGLLTALMLCSCGAVMYKKSVTNGDVRRYHYLCKVKAHRDHDSNGQRHVTIAARIAEEVVEDAVIESIGLGLLDPPEEHRIDMTRVQRELVDIRAKQAAATDALLVPGVDKPRVSKRLRDLAEAAEELEAERSAILGTSAQGSALDEYKRAIGGWTIYDGDKLDEYLAQGREAWRALDIEKRRSIIRGSFRVSVTPGGYGHERVKVELL